MSIFYHLKLNEVAALPSLINCADQNRGRVKNEVRIKEIKYKYLRKLPIFLQYKISCYLLDI
jgi:hypothetical protein